MKRKNVLIITLFIMSLLVVISLSSEIVTNGKTSIEVSYALGDSIYYDTIFNPKTVSIHIEYGDKIQVFRSHKGYIAIYPPNDVLKWK